MLPIRKEGERGLGLWEPFRDLRRMHDEMDRLFSSLWPTGDGDLTKTAVWLPAVDMYEEKDRVIVQAELPGVKKEDMSLSLTEDSLTIKGQRKFEHEEKREGFYRMECRYGSFQRTLELPFPVKASAVKAEYKDGILIITLPKAEEAKTREIKIDVK